jgi:YkoY family integral membrane protein
VQALNILTNFFTQFAQTDLKTAWLVIANLVVIESLLSADNAAVLATMVVNLSPRQQKEALRIGIVFAYIFRGLALVSASVLIRISWLKLLGGAYLLFLFTDFFYEKFSKQIPGLTGISKRKKAPRKILGLNGFWSTVVMVEMVDLTFSIDNVFAAVAYTNNIYLIFIGVFIGIITMRIIAGYFAKLMQKLPFLETLAFLLVGILGMRLVLDFMCAILPENVLCGLLHSRYSDYYFSMLTLAIFFLPILTSLLFNFPNRVKKI